MRFTKKFKDPAEWHDFFCLIPRVIAWNDRGIKIAWLERIQRRKVYDWYDWYWEYRFKGEDGKNEKSN